MPFPIATADRSKGFDTGVIAALQQWVSGGAERRSLENQWNRLP